MNRAEKMQFEHAAIAAHHEKLAKLHRDDGEHDHAVEHAGLAKRHAALAKHCGATTAKADSGNLEKRDSDLRDVIKKMVTEEIGNTVRPTEIHAVIPNWPGVTLVPRHGSPQEPAKQNVDSQFEKMFAIEHSEEPTLIGR